METRRTFCHRTGLVLAGLSSLHSLALPESDDAGWDTLDLTLETAYVLWELHVFEQSYLPVLLDQSAPGARPHPSSSSPTALARWQYAVRQLQQAVPRRGPCRSAPSPEAIRNLCADIIPGCAELLNHQPPACFSQVAGRICWHIYPYTGQSVAEREEQVRFVLRWAGDGDEQTAAPWLELRQVLPAVQEFFLTLPPTSDKKLGGYIAVLPILAELNPAFAAQAVDRRRLVAAVESHPFFTPEQRLRQRRFLDNNFFARCLCNGLTLVLEALANNHFPKIARFLTLPEIHADSYWSELIPKILFATLYRKTEILRDLTRNISPGRAGRDSGDAQR